MTAAVLTVLATISVALISLVGTIVTANSNSSRLQAEIDKHNAIQDTKLEEITRELKDIKSMAIEVPVLKQRIVAVSYTHLTLPTT